MFKPGTLERRALNRYIRENPEMRGIPPADIQKGIEKSFVFEALVMHEAFKDFYNTLKSEVKKLLKKWRIYGKN